MDFNDTPEQAQFRNTCREWLEKNAEPKSKKKREGFADIDFLDVAKEWQKKKYDAGWAMLHWPKSTEV
jgi:alkylation response protein AidB-like acyl-CoA dehydrogenase